MKREDCLSLQKKLLNKPFNVFSAGFLLLSLVACDMYATEHRNQKIKDVELTTKEIKFVDSLKTIGLKHVILRRPPIGIVAYGTNSQSLLFSNGEEISDKYGADSLKRLSKDLAMNLYLHVLEDSSIFDCEEIIIASKYKDKRTVYKSQYFDKDSLELWTGLKIIRKGPDSWSRVKR